MKISSKKSEYIFENIYLLRPDAPVLNLWSVCVREREREKVRERERGRERGRKRGRKRAGKREFSWTQKHTTNRGVASSDGCVAGYTQIQIHTYTRR